MKEKYFKKLMCSIFISFIICVFSFAPLAQDLRVARVYADADDGANIASLAENAISAVGTIAQTAFSQSINLKEFFFDPAGWGLGNILLKDMIRSTTQWVNSGFKGNPAFVTDLNGFLTNVGDKYVGHYLSGTKLNFLCSPFQLNIKAAIDLQYGRNRSYQAPTCRLSSIVNNMDNFLNGNFSDGGWAGWKEVALGNSNPYTNKFEAEAAMYAGLSNAQGQEVKLLDFGRGYMTMQNCVEDESGGHCTNTTPGALIQEQLGKAISLPGERLAVADELNELIGSLFSQLASQALSGAGGLLGLTEPGYGSGSGNYFNRLDTQRDDSGNAGDSANLIKTSLDNENQYKDLQNTIIRMVNDAEVYRQRVYPSKTVVDESGKTQTVTCTPGTLTSSLAQKRADAQSAVATSTMVISALNVFKSDYDLLRSSTTPQSVITSLQTKYKSNSIPGTQSALIERYSTYQTSGKIHGIETNVRLKLETVPAIQAEIGSFTATIDAACREQNNVG